MPEFNFKHRVLPGVAVLSQPSRGGLLTVDHRVLPGRLSISQPVAGSDVTISQRVGRNVIFGLQRIKPPGVDPNDYILQENGFSIPLEDGSGSILME